MAAKDWIPAFAGMTVQGGANDGAWGSWALPGEWRRRRPGKNTGLGVYRLPPPALHTSFPRRRESLAAKDWIPAFAGMTVQGGANDGAWGSWAMPGEWRRRRPGNSSGACVYG